MLDLALLPGDYAICRLPAGSPLPAGPGRSYDGRMRTAATVLAIVALGCLLSACTRELDDPAPLLPVPSGTTGAPSTSRSPTPLSTPIVPATRPSSARASTSPSGF